jgi:membrane protein DedA with SNARE-associated domain
LLAAFFHEAHRYVGDYGYAAVMVGLVAENLGLPLPGETLLITGAALASRGTLDIWLLLPLAWLSAVIGNTIGFFIGRTGGQRLLIHYGDRFGITRDRLFKVEGFVRHYGALVIIFARFIVVARQLSGIAAGSLNMHFLRFSIFNAIGAALWVGFWGLLAYWLGGHVFQYLAQFMLEEPVLLTVAGVALAAGIAYVVWHARRVRGANGRDT